ncbi:hypothetical protein Pmani_018258 [Petrolisthes manimaculis]|uniref:Uncharacterized protein n=1 Tax=Petrolisthes manimaculis TaxID=1843537 RepID=A0AAE1U4P0_9EUCA|nr:hypothetical protein Pmani_018258 [Petrolisthes manimaculis]
MKSDVSKRHSAQHNCRADPHTRCAGVRCASCTMTLSKCLPFHSPFLISSNLNISTVNYDASKDMTKDDTTPLGIDEWRPGRGFVWSAGSLLASTSLTPGLVGGEFFFLE